MATVKPYNRTEDVSKLEESNPVQPRSTISITLTYDQVTGVIQVTGAPPSEILFFGLWRKAELAMAAQYAAMQTRRIIPASFPPNNNHPA